MTLSNEIEQDEGTSCSFEDDFSDEEYVLEDSSSDVDDVPEWGKQECETMSLGDLHRDMMSFVNSVRSIVPIDVHDLIMILARYAWDIEKFQDEWFTRPAKKQKCTQDGGHSCHVCFEDFDEKSEYLRDCGCGHGLCKDCWGNYVESRVELGPVCLDLMCPVPECGKRVPHCLLSDLASPQCLERIDTYALESYVEHSKNIAWCPGVDCGRAVKMHRGHGAACASCHMEFCFGCRVEAHSPVDCSAVKKWLDVYGEDTLNCNWILMNTKECPKCSTNIEKNMGCMHMTCSQCHHGFCWLCLKPWRRHDYSACRSFLHSDGKNAESSQATLLRRQMHFWKGWAEHDNAMNIVKKSLREWQNEGLDKLAQAREIPPVHLEFITDSWREVARCRRILKWTYVAAYYAFEGNNGAVKESEKDHPDDAAMKQCKTFFIFTQNDAENALERLSRRVEKDLQAFLPPNEPPPDNKDAKKETILEKQKAPSKEDWESFRNDLLSLTDVTRNQFAKLVTLHEQGLNKSIQEMRDQSYILPVAG